MDLAKIEAAKGENSEHFPSTKTPRWFYVTKNLQKHTFGGLGTHFFGHHA